jgi:uncharacterized repeat protein (TIGR01451 family)
VQPRTAGADVAAGVLSLAAGADLGIVIDGTAVDEEYTQLNVDGAVDLAGVDLVLGGTYVPAGGEVFTIVSAGSVAGTFNGLPDGAAVVLNGVSLTIHYTATAVTLGDAAATGAISGFKWHDLNGNGEWDEGEPPLEGWTIYLDLNNNGRLDDGEPFTVTAADGSYAFTGLPEGTYTVAEVMQDGWQQTFPNGAGSSSLLSASGTDAADGVVSTKVYALLPADDLNGNGQVDAGETITYTIDIHNPTGRSVTDVFFTDTPDPNTSLVVGSVTTTAGTITSGNAAGETTIVVDIGTMSAGQPECRRQPGGFAGRQA